MRSGVLVVAWFVGTFLMASGYVVLLVLAGWRVALGVMLVGIGTNMAREVGRRIGP